ncbi:MAG: nucleoside recognition protein [Desulfobulbus sp.]|nr:nucleoside recognition protein [Desulfobulbus sp.]
MKQLLGESLRSSVTSGLLILKYVVPFYILADILLYFDLLKYLGFLFAPFTSLLDLPPEAAVSLAGGVFINIYAAIAFAAPLGLSPYQWTILAVFLGICHSMLVESAIMAKLGISSLYSVLLRGIGACLIVIPVLFMPASWFTTTTLHHAMSIPHSTRFSEMLLHSLGKALVLSVEIIGLISLIIVAMDLLKSTRFLQAHLAKVNTSFSIIAGQLLGITYGAGILLREANRGSLTRENILYIGTFLMICHSIIEDVFLFVLFGANYWVVIGVRLPAALLISLLMIRLFRFISLDYVVRR